ncbi:ROK family transcriptional regulator [Micromonospora endophytica]|uniref:ROK family transcriptional regulator n=1 Tax=Micromonospora endophytica TaxID=515350 RepID=A0A2W2CNI0_9ACTN|nr:ROK family transcriptional regulator [Micromonospora endophytica]PZG01046.1 ROK family transcriptional regulator [Micromonospora endophytica]RIW47912.1 ROK family transcriptional regulator [Micromonospora endophytica]BCJ62283.1 transcriptional regulator [Micromonospora endophytica]
MTSRTTARTATTRDVTEINRTAILDTLAQRGPLTRSALREHTGLSPATVERLCSALADAGIIERCGTEKSRGGRPSTLFRFAGERRVVVAASVSADSLRGVLVGVDGSHLDRTSRPVEPGTGPDARLQATLELIGELLDRARADQRVALGVALSVPGVVDDEGQVSNSAELGWQRLAVGAIVERRFELPCLVENDANAIALGEWTQGAGIGAESLASLVLGIGVGAGLVAGGRLIRGARAGAGEIGYLLTGRDSLGTLFAQHGDLESRINDTAARYRPDQRTSGAAGLLDAVATGDPQAGELAEVLLDYLALAVAALATVFDPEIVVLSGKLPRDPAGVVRALEHRLTGRIPLPPRVVCGQLGDDAPLVGVGELMARRTKGSVYLV